MINMSPLSLPFKEKTNLFYSIEEEKESSFRMIVYNGMHEMNF